MMTHVFQFGCKPAPETMRHGGIPMKDVRHFLPQWNEGSNSGSGCRWCRGDDAAKEARAIQARRRYGAERHIRRQQRVAIESVVRDAGAGSYNCMR